MILPLDVLGRSATKRTSRGRLYAASRLLGEGDDVLLAGRRARPQDDVRAGQLALHRVGHRPDRDRGDRRMLDKHALDLRGVDVVAGGDDHVLQAIDDEEVAVGARVREVAGMQPAIGIDRLGGRQRRCRDNRSSRSARAPSARPARPCAAVRRWSSRSATRTSMPGSDTPIEPGTGGACSACVVPRPAISVIPHSSISGAPLARSASARSPRIAIVWPPTVHRVSDCRS